MEASWFVWSCLYLLLVREVCIHCNASAEQECGDALGMESGAIPDGKITASSQAGPNDAAHYARLNLKKPGGLIIGGGSWTANVIELNPWLQIDLSHQKTIVTRVATQGKDHPSSQLVMTYRLQYSNNTSSFQYVKEQGRNKEKVFNGNKEPSIPVFQKLTPPITARYIRFRPVTWFGRIALRVELYGCLLAKEHISVRSSGVKGAGTGLCRSLKFSTPLNGYALEGHVIKNTSLSVAMSETCKEHCTMEKYCVSFNTGPADTDKVLCQLSDSDSSLHPNDLRRRSGFSYRGTENPCSSNPCLHNGTCLSGFTDKKYLCVCETGVWGARCEQVPRSCKELYDRNMTTSNKAYLLSLDSNELLVYCHMTSDLGACKGGGWTLVMKIDGRKNTFHYDSTYWTSKTGNNLTNGMTGFDDHETQLPTYWNTSFTKICLGMTLGSRQAFVVIDKIDNSTIHSTLFSLIADGEKRSTSLGRETWKTLLGAQASLQQFCNYEGFNQVCSHAKASRARIGIVNNDNHLCNTCDSRLGFGTGGYIDDTNTCGSVGPGSSEYGGKNNKVMGYILVQ